MPKRSENARAVAREVRSKIEKGEKVLLGEIIEKHGYTEASTKTPKNVTGTLSYQEEIAPFVAQLVERRQASIQRLTDEKLDESSAVQLSSVIDTLTKNIQLLTGGDTERSNSNEIRELKDSINKLIESVK